MTDGRRHLRILHVPVDLGGHARSLAQAQRALGHEAVAVSLAWSALGFNGDECFDAPIGTPGRLRRREAGRYRLLWRSLVWPDVIHCHFGQTLFSVRPLPLREPTGGRLDRAIAAYAKLLWLRDLAFWRAAGKRMAMTFYGDDVRLVSEALRRAPHTHLGHPRLRALLEPRDASKRQLVRTLAQAGVHMFAVNPDLLAVLPPQASFLPYGHVDPEAQELLLPRAEERLRFVHMPTDRDVKGTSLFVEAVEALRREGHDVELTLVEGRQNHEALQCLAAHDVLLDQLRVGWFGGVAVEAMAMGKPVVAWINPADLALTPPLYAKDLPVIPADPTDVMERLRAIVTMPRDRLRALGRASRSFVETWHHPQAVARMTLDAYGMD
jgi:hypothetical protein